MFPETTMAKYPSIDPDGIPYYIDEQPPPGEWVYYTLFVLDSNRVWKAAGSVYEIGPDDFNWTLRLPELMPGAAVSVEQGVAHPADQASDLVQFLQGPAICMDIAQTMAEAMQYFWDPIKVPPQMIGDLAQSWGYQYDGTLGMGRVREVLAALHAPSQGSLNSISRLVTAATGCEVAVLMSNNLMLNTADSSFETGSIKDTSWGPTLNLQILDYYSRGPSDPDPIAPPNVELHYFLYVTAPTRIHCGYQTNDDMTQTLDPVGRGIPISRWKVVRMGCYAYDRPESPTDSPTDLKMGLDLYDMHGALIGTLDVVSARRLTDAWKWHGQGDGTPGADVTVPIDIPDLEMALPGATTEANRWSTADPPYAGPQITPPTVAPEGLTFAWASPPANDGEVAMWKMHEFSDSFHLGWTYRISMTVNGTSNGAFWRPSVMGRSAGALALPDGTDQTVEFDWVFPGGEAPQIGIEITKPSLGWAEAGTHTVKAFSVKRVDAPYAYGVPWIDVSNACYVDLIVTDDG